jgi:hypothetical protein
MVLIVADLASTLHSQGLVSKPNGNDVVNISEIAMQKEV